MPRTCPTGLDNPVDPILAKIALPVDDDGRHSGTLQPLALREGSSCLAARAGFGELRRQIVGVDAGALRRPPNGFRLVNIEPLDPGGFEKRAIEIVTLVAIGRVKGASRQRFAMKGRSRPARDAPVEDSGSG